MRLVAKEAGLVDGQDFQQRRELRLAFAAGQQTVVAVKRVQAAGLQAPLQPVLQEVRAAFVEVHAAFLVNQGLQ